MKIVVRSPQGPNLWIPFPSCLVFNRFSSDLVVKVMKGNGMQLSKDQAKHLIKALNQYRRKHRDWVLVEVKSADGDYVKIKL